MNLINTPLGAYEGSEAPAVHRIGGQSMVHTGKYE